MAGNGKVAAAGLASILVVAMVVAVAIGVSKKDNQINKSNKAADALCSNTDYKETCQKSVSKTDSNDPKEIVRSAIEYSLEHIANVVKESKTYKEAAQDKSTKDALDVCEEVLNTSVDDLKRSFDKVGEYGVESGEEMVEDLKSWLSAIGTYRDTCIEAFDKTSGDTAEKMKQQLQTTKELSSNALALLDQIASVIKSLNENFKGRKLLEKDQTGFDYDYGLSELFRAGHQQQRRLLEEDQTGLGNDHGRGELSKPRAMYEFDSPTAAEAAINAVVAPDGSAQYKTIGEAIKAVPPTNNNTFVIFVKTGVYNEQVTIPKYMNKIVLKGEGPDKTKITSNKNFVDGVKIFYSATVAVNGDDFVCKDLSIENSSPPEKRQAVALRVSGDRAVFSDVKVDGFQDTLYAHTYRQFYRDCTISGTVDFVFGDALAIFQNCNFIVRKPLDPTGVYVTAQGRLDARSQGAYVIQGGRITASPEFLGIKPPIPAYLGRPWKEFSRTIIMQTEIDAFIAPEGWSPFSGNLGLDTLYYAEYQNKGPGADTAKRVQWKGIQKFDQPTAEGWTPGKQFGGGGDKWIKDTEIPYEPAMLKL